VIFGLQIVCGLLLLARLFVPIALTILAGYLFNIYIFHLLFDHTFSPMGGELPRASAVGAAGEVAEKHGAAVLYPELPLSAAGEAIDLAPSLVGGAEKFALS
jgi:hypothetical protein